MVGRLRDACVAALTCALLTWSSLVATPARCDLEVVASPVDLSVAQGATSLAATLLTRQAFDDINAWFDAYVHARVTDVAPLARPAASFGPWRAPEDFGAAEAASDGSLTEWDRNYYICHDWSDYGRQVLGMTVGDTVRVNGHTFVVEGVFEYPKRGFLNEVRLLVGEDAYVIQTCVPDADRNRIVFGYDA